jgi:hypothetical protein
MFKVTVPVEAASLMILAGSSESPAKDKVAAELEAVAPENACETRRLPDVIVIGPLERALPDVCASAFNSPP